MAVSRPGELFEKEIIQQDNDLEPQFSVFTRAIVTGDEKKIKRLLEVAADDERNWTDANSGKTVLHVAACSDNGFMEVFLDNEHIRGHINVADLEGMTPLMEAVAHGNVSAVKLLLATGASINNVSNSARQNALHIAAAMDKCECMKELLKGELLPNVLNALDGNGNTPLMLCSSLKEQYDCAWMLLEAGARVELKNPNTGRTVLHMAILESSKRLVGVLLDNSCNPSFLNVIDKFNDTALRLAVRMEEVLIIRRLLLCPQAQELVWEFPEIAHHAITSNDADLFAQVLPMFENDELMAWTDSQGRTALMVAVELGRTQMIKDMFHRGVRASLFRDTRGESVLHKAVASGDNEILTLLLEGGNVGRLINLKDFSGRCALELALASDRFSTFALLWNSGLFPNKSLNSELETTLYFAAKYNNYGSFLMLLMSPNCITYVMSLLNNESVSDVELERAYLRKHIYASDLFIMTGKIEKNSNWNFCPPQSFQTTTHGRTIFHACAIGGSCDIIRFFYRFCEIFYPRDCEKIDQPDAHGSTPLLLACQCDHEEMAKFLLLKGGKLCKEDHNRMSPLTAVYKNSSHRVQFMDEILSNRVISDGWVLGDEYADPKALVIDFSMLCPEGEPYIRVTSKIFQTFRNFEESQILLHPVLQIYVLIMLSKVKFYFSSRYTVRIMSTLTFTAYLTTKHCKLVPDSPTFLRSLRLLSVSFFVLLFLWSLSAAFSTLTQPKWCHAKTQVVISLLAFIYFIHFDGDDRTSLEVAATTALLTWIALLPYCVRSPLRRQKAMFTVIFASMYRYYPVCFIVSAGFCFFFFVIFHDYFAFTNPFHSLLYSAFQLPRGDLGLIPVLTNDPPIRGANTTNFKITKDQSETVDIHQELRALLVEGTVLLFFLIVSSTITNLFTVLAVKSNEQITLGGEVYELTRLVNLLDNCEQFIFGKPFSFLKEIHLLWLLCVSFSTREQFKPPKLVYPLVNKPEGFELLMIKHHFTKRQNLVTNQRVTYFLEWFFFKGKFGSHLSTDSSFNKMVLEV